MADNNNTKTTTTTPTTTIRMPAEWERHQACLILYPHNPQTFRLEFAQEQVWQVAMAISQQGKEQVYLLVKDEREKQALLAKHPDDTMTLLSSDEENKTSTRRRRRIQVEICPSNDTWVRDTGPTCCIQETTTSDNNSTCSRETSLVGVDWDFNAYGGPVEGCYWPCDLDRQIASRICQDLLQHLPIQIQKSNLVLEGGSIHTDGQGTLLVTEECLLNPNRNPHLQKTDIEALLKETLHMKTILWLPHGLDADEDTNGHVDNFCCFVRPGHVVLAWTDDGQEDAENYRRCRAAQDLLISSQDAQGRTLQVHKLYLPPPLRYTREEAESFLTEDGKNRSGDTTTTTNNNDIETAVERQEGEKLAASYVNFYIANEAVVVPQFGVPTTDAQAIPTLQTLFPTRTVVGIPSREILLGGGNIHCITQQVPDPKIP